MAANYVFIGQSSVPGKCRPAASLRPDSTGLYVSYHADGQLKKLSYVRNGKDFEWLTLDAGKPAGKRENTAEVQEFLTNGKVEEYSGRYEHGPYDPKISYEQWVRRCINEVLEAERTDAGVAFIRWHKM
jgi:hypothetical protein